ncbi:MAG: hypothetical protein QM704_04095 [Anaeromyxobacteraceae bacterium]
MIDLERELSELSRLRSTAEPVVSLYLDLRFTDERARDRVRDGVRAGARRALDHTLPDAPGMDGLRRTLERVTAHVDGLTAATAWPEAQGLALFACGAIGLWRPLLVRLPLEDALEVDGFPHLLQLARLRDDFAPAIVVVASAQGADLYEVSLGELAAEASLRGEVPRSDGEKVNAGTGKPGRHYDREAKDERRERSVIRRNLQAAAREATVRFDRAPAAAVVLVGTAENVAAFERELPQRLKERVVARLARPRAWVSDAGQQRTGVVENATQAVTAHERGQETQLVEHLVGEALRGRLAVIGPADVVTAVNQRRVHRLVLHADLDGTGWECGQCDAIGANAETQEECPYCGGELRVLRNLAEALVIRTLAVGGDVEVVAPERRLGSYRGVGAYLRQTAATGLRGASQPWPTAPGASQP